MKRLNRILLIVLQVLILTSFNSIFGQSKWLIGLAPSYELHQSNGRLGLGIQVNHKLSDKYSIETGVNYRSAVSEYLFQIDPMSSFNAKVRENYLWTPILIKRHGKFANISGGFTIQKYVGYTDLTENSNTEITKHNVNPDWGWGTMVKLGHSIAIGERFLLEPEISANFLIYEEVFIYNLGVCAQYKF